MTTVGLKRLKSKLTNLTLNKYSYLIILLVLLITSSCKEDFIPRPKGYFRITLPHKSYNEFKSECNFSFKYPGYTIISTDRDYNSEPCWYNLDFPLFRARLHMSYKHVDSNLNQLLEDSYTLAMKHSAKADAIDQHIFAFPEKEIYGTIYDIKGNAASVLQFYLTDSTSNFFRGSLYFSHVPNKDSIAPVVGFIASDIDTLINSFAWE